MENMSSQRRSTVKPETIEPDPAKPYGGLSFLKSFVKRGAKEIVILDAKDRPVLATISYNRACIYAKNLKYLYGIIRKGVQDLNPGNDITFIRVRLEKREIMFTVSTGFTLIVVQSLPSLKNVPSSDLL